MKLSAKEKEDKVRYPVFRLKLFQAVVRRRILPSSPGGLHWRRCKNRDSSFTITYTTFPQTVSDPSRRCSSFIKRTNVTHLCLPETLLTPSCVCPSLSTTQPAMNSVAHTLNLLSSIPLSQHLLFYYQAARARPWSLGGLRGRRRGYGCLRRGRKKMEKNHLVCVWNSLNKLLSKWILRLDQSERGNSQKCIKWT